MTMPAARSDDQHDDRAYVERLLTAARRTIEEVRYCWAATAAEDGGANARLVMPFAAGPEEDVWTRCFLTNRHSRKAAEMRRSPAIALAYQQDGGDAYVTLVGRAELIEDPARVRHYWKPAWDAHSAVAQTKMIIVRVTAERIELHVRGTTPEPFGFGRTVVERERGGAWRLAPGYGELGLAPPSV
jgi:general stress protein 26